MSRFGVGKMPDSAANEDHLFGIPVCYCQKDFDMDARNNLKIIHTVDGAILQNRYGKAVIRSHDIGLISLPTGEIVMADPTLRFEIADFKRKAFQQKVK